MDAICINNEGCENHLTLYKVYEVLEVHEPFISIVVDDGDTVSVVMSRFEILGY